MRLCRATIRAVLALFVLAVPRLAAAQDPRAEIARRELLQQAERARARGDHAGAVTFGTRALEIRATPSLRLMLAQAHEALGHPLDALDQATACAREAIADSSLRNREQLIEGCRELSETLGARVARVVLRVTPREAPGLRVRIGDREVPTTLLGIPMPVVPGSVSVVAESSDARTARRTLTLAPGRTQEIELSLAQTAPNQAATPQPTAAMTADVPSPIAPAPTDDGVVASPARRTWGWVALGLGIVGLGIGIGGVVMREGGAIDYNGAPLSNGGVCPGTSFAGIQPGFCQNYLDQIATGEAMAWTGLLGGTALVATGAALLATAPSSRARASAGFHCGASWSGLQCAGAF